MTRQTNRTGAYERRAGASPGVAPAGDDLDGMGGDVGIREARYRFGGVDVPATLAGTLAALGRTVLLGGLVAAAGSYGYQLGLKDVATKLSVGGLVAGLVTVMLVAGWLGGWLGERYHRRADAVVTNTRPGAIAAPRRVVRGR